MLKPDIEKPDSVSLIKTFAVSTVSAICAYYIVFFFSNYSVLFFAYDFDIKATFSLDGITFPPNVLNHGWSRDAMITILLSKPFSAFVIGIIFLFIFMSRTKKIVAITLLLFWTNLFAFSFAFGELIADIIYKTGTYEVVSAMNINIVYLIMMAICIAFILYKVGMMNGKLIKQSFSHQYIISLKSQLVFFTAILLAPWLLTVIFSWFCRSDFSLVPELLKSGPAIILLFPFLVKEKPENLNFKFASSDGFSLSDFILIPIYIILSIILLLVMKNGIVISG